MRWIVTGVALAVVALTGVDVARACGGCCKGGGGCPTCPQSGPSGGPAAPAGGPGACPTCPCAESGTGGDRLGGGVAGYSPYPAPARPGYDPSGRGGDRPVVSPPPPTVTHSTSYLAAPRPVQTTSRYERPAR